MRRLALAALLICGLMGLAPARAGEGSNSTVGGVVLPSGLKVVYSYHFDHNAFADSVDLPGGLIALTPSGNLLRFDRKTLERGREWFGPSRVTCLGSGENGQALIGFEDGRIARLDPASLDTTVVATLPGKPHWIGFKAGDEKTTGGIVVVVERWRWADATRDGLGQLGFPNYGPLISLRFGNPRAKTSRQEWMPYSEVHDLGSGKSCAIKGRAASVHLDRKHRVWLGYELGEFGGWCRRVDLSNDEAKLVPWPLDPTDLSEPYYNCVLGFAELRGGQVWALGGVMHMLGSISIWRVDQMLVETLVDLDGTFPVNDPRFGPGKPDSPIERIVEEAKPGSLLAFSEDGTIYRTGATLERFVPIQELDLRSAEFQPEVGDSYSNLRAVHVREDGLVCATARDGYVFVAFGAEDAKKIVPDQLEAHSIRKIEVTSEGTFYNNWMGESPWQYREGRWTQEPVRLPGDRFRENPSMVIGPSGAIFAIDGEVTLRWHKGKVETVGAGVPTEPVVPFVTSDGSLWAVAGGREEEAPNRFPRFGQQWWERNRGPGQLLRLVSGKWAKVADLPGAIGPDWSFWSEFLDNGEMIFGDRQEVRKTRRTDGAGFPHPLPAKGKYHLGEELRVVNQTGPRWLIHDRDEEQLFGLDSDADLPSPRFAPIPIEEGPLPLKVYDAISWSREDVLIATRKGLKLCEIVTGKHRPAPLPSPGRSVKRLARDGFGRLWLCGEGLWMVDTEGRLHDLASVPMVGHSAVSALAADPEHKDGAIVSLGVRGVALLRVESKP
jgi:hypothetical protein